MAEAIYSGGFRNGWRDVSGPNRTLAAPGPARVEISRDLAWKLSRDTPYEHPFGTLALRTRGSTPRPDFVEVQLNSRTGDWFPTVHVADIHTSEFEGGFQLLFPFEELNPHSTSFDGLSIWASRAHSDGPLVFDQIGLTQAKDTAESQRLLTTPARLLIDCRGPSRKISPLVYGFNYYGITDKQGTQWEMGGTARRWGGNTMSRYNWSLGNAWNTGRDWFYENVQVEPYTVFLDGNRAHGVRAALTVPMIGWVAKDTTSYSFPTSVFGPQHSTDKNHRPDAGNGVDAKGKPIPPGPPTRTSIAVGPEFVGGWVSAIRERDRAAHERSVDIYVLDNEPGLWHQTHRDVHPEPLSYDELLQRSLAYGATIRAADPGAKIAGPAAAGWPDIQYSALDTVTGWRLRPDRRAHGDVPLLPWYLRRMREEEERTKTHILDYVDVHWYPQSDGIYGDTKTDAASAALRIRSTRSLWDKTYKDESYIGEPVYLLPRLQAWIDENFPGLGIMIGEWNFGGEKHMSGGLATAEALGSFTRHGVAAAFYWTVPPAQSPSLYAFRAYRNFDGRGGKFLDYSLSTQTMKTASLYASRDAAGGHIVAVALNVSPDTALDAQIDLSECGSIDTRRAFVYTGNPNGFVEEPAVKGENSRLSQLLPAYSITVFDVHLSEPIATQVAP